MNQKKPPSFLLSVACTFVFAYAASSIVHFVGTNLTWYADYEKRREVELVNYGRLSYLLLKHGEPAEVLARLQEARQLKKLEFFLLKQNGKLLAYEDSVTGQDLRAKTFEPRRLVTAKDAVYLDVQQGEFEVVMGLNRARSTYVQMLWDEAKGRVLLDIALIGLLATLIVLYNFRDILNLIRAIQNRSGREKYKTVEPSSAEAKVILRSLETYDQNLLHFRRESEGYQQQIVSALRTELQSGKTPPYEFDCTMVRTDINRYSTICAEHTMLAFLPVVNEFFAGASAIVSAYRGYVADFVGDEIIFYFKDEDHRSAPAAALAAVRDIEALAERIHNRTKATYPFRVKSSVADGPLHFGPQVDRLSLSGGVFVETVRILSEVEEKEENRVYFPERLAARLDGVCSTALRKRVQLRGINGATDLHWVEQFAQLESLLANGEGLSCLLYFREEHHLHTILDHLFAHHGSVCERGQQGYFLAALLSVGKPSASPALRDAFTRALEKVAEANLESENGMALLRGLLTSARVLLTKELLNDTLRKLMDDALTSADARTVANAVDALVYFDPQAQDGLLEALLHHTDNRILGNALIKLGIVDLSRKVTAGLRNLLDSKDSLRVASGAYAAATLAKHYLDLDPVRFKAREDVGDIFSRIEKLVGHVDPSVRRQSERALATWNAVDEKDSLQRVA